MKESVAFDWVIGRFEGKQADWVDANANTGIGYFIRTVQGRGKDRVVVAAFRRPRMTPLPSHLDLALSSEVEKLEGLYRQRHGIKVRMN